jgi:hypothetical protein
MWENLGGLGGQKMLGGLEGQEVLGGWGGWGGRMVPLANNKLIFATSCRLCKLFR